MIYWTIFFSGAAIIIILFQKYIRTNKVLLPVLMYHRVSANGIKDDLTVASLMLERQFHYLKKQEFTPVLLSQLVDFVLHKKPLPEKPVLITFDDGYRDNYTVLYPLLKQYGVTANIFLVPSFISDNQNGGNKSIQATDEYLKLSDITSMDPSIVEFGLHSYSHKNFNNFSSFELNDDITQSKAVLNTLDIPFQPCLAFPYGAFPKKNHQKKADFFETLNRNKIVLGFRIGNRLNRIPFKNTLLLQRLDIKGNMTFKEFTQFIKKGKLFFL
ncbi:MAG: polysaccharide deacetylase family protein [Ferruginibacter sp.]